MPYLKIKRLHPDAVIPSYATEGAACFDIRTTESGEVPPESSRLFSTGLAFELSADWALMLYSRSGHGFKDNIRLANCVGVIDSDYRGEVKVKLTNDGATPFLVNAGDRIAQAMLQEVNQVKFIEVNQLFDTERGVGGFGSTGMA